MPERLQRKRWNIKAISNVIRCDDKLLMGYGSQFAPTLYGMPCIQSMRVLTESSRRNRVTDEGSWWELL